MRERLARLSGMALIVWLLQFQAMIAGDLSLRTDFPGGAAKLLSIDQQRRHIRFEVPESPVGAHRSWWYFRVDGSTPDETLTLELNFGRTRVKRAAYSPDGSNWSFTPPAVADEAAGTSTFSQRVTSSSSYFAWYVPYLQSHAERVVAAAERACPHARKFELCRSEAGRRVWAVRFAEPGATEDSRYGIWIQARQHAWEVGGSWTAHGLIEWLSSDDESAIALRRKAQIFVVPIMDVDSVEKGSGGKWQLPHDHNRDWSDKPYWNSVKAAMARCKELDNQGRLDVFLDLHDPTWQAPFEFWCNPYPVMLGPRRRNTDYFLMCARGEIVGPLVFDPEVFSPYTLDTPTAGNWSSQRTRSHVVGGTVEVGVYPPTGFDAAPPLQHLVAGTELGRTLERYLKRNPRRIKE